MIATLAAGSAAVCFLLALVLVTLSGFDRGSATAALVGLLLLAVAVSAIASDRRPN